MALLKSFKNGLELPLIIIYQVVINIAQAFCKVSISGWCLHWYSDLVLQLL